LDAIKKRVDSRLAEVLGCDVSLIRPDSHLIDDLGMDSLDIVELSMTMEEEFDIYIDDSIFKSLSTVGDIYPVIAEICQ